ncbi:hypothetical protein FRC07_014895 [Ceratobasidium sp. 392]|nr:hypothetical protein FRC07_014895 [Ceratobasidium sp. 392]
MEWRLLELLTMTFAHPGAKDPGVTHESKPKVTSADHDCSSKASKNPKVADATGEELQMWRRAVLPGHWSHSIERPEVQGRKGVNKTPGGAQDKPAVKLEGNVQTLDKMPGEQEVQGREKAMLSLDNTHGVTPALSQVSKTLDLDNEGRPEGDLATKPREVVSTSVLDDNGFVMAHMHIARLGTETAGAAGDSCKMYGTYMMNNMRCFPQHTLLIKETNGDSAEQADKERQPPAPMPTCTPSKERKRQRGCEA